MHLVRPDSTRDYYRTIQSCLTRWDYFGDISMRNQDEYTKEHSGTEGQTVQQKYLKNFKANPARVYSHSKTPDDLIYKSHNTHCQQ